jgi:Flp pilus assembly protein TadG
VVVALVFFTMVFCIIEMDRALMVCHLLSEASRRGARAAAIEGTSNTDVNSAVDNYLPTAGVTGYTTTVLVNDAVANANTANATDEITVKVSVPASSTSWNPAVTFFFNGTFTEQYTLRRE